MSAPDLETVLDLIRELWPHRYQRGIILHIHKNNLTLPDGSEIHLRVLVQTLRKDTDHDS